MVLFAIGSAVARTTVVGYLKHSVWLVPWIGGNVLIGALGQYGNGAAKFIPEWWDIVCVATFSLVIFRWAVSLGLPSPQVAAAVEKDSHQLAGLTPA